MNSRRRFSWSLALLLLPGVIGMTGGRLSAQDTTHAVSATLLRVLGEAADDYRTGRPVYVVANRSFPHTVLGVFAERGEALRAVADSGERYEAFGPYVTPRDSLMTGRNELIGVTLTYRSADSTSEVRVDPREIDALFFTASAVDKFFIRYYSDIYGPRVGNLLRLRFRDSEAAGGACHRLGTIICEILPLRGRTQIVRLEDLIRP